MAYASEAEVAAALGQETLMPAQQAQYALWAPSAEAWITDYTGRTWETGPILAERHEPFGPTLYLTQRPLVSVEAVRVGCWYATTVRTLTPPQGVYVDYAHGRLRFPWWGYGSAYGGYDYAEVDYTPDDTVPAPVGLAAAQLLADGMVAATSGGGGNLAGYSVFGQVSVQFRPVAGDSSDPMTVAVSPTVVSLLQAYRTPVLA